jgi:hypothetical protein
MKTIRCAGLRFDGACAKQQQCANHAKWWQVAGVEFNACGDAKVLKHFTPLGVTLAPAPSKTTQEDLFA